MRIDVHAHYYPTALYELIERVTGSARNRPTGFVRGFSHHLTIDQLLELMSGAGIDRMVMSLGNTPPYYQEPQHGIEIARGGNDLYAALHSQHPQRFNSFVSVPLPHIDAALAELDRATALPGMVGVALGCSVLGKPLDHPDFDAFFAELDRRQAVTFVHPVGAGGGPNSDDFGMTWMLASRFEDTIALARLILSGLTLKYPRIRFIFPHLGGTIPLFLQRMDNVAERQGWAEQSPNAPPSELVRRMWFDTVNEQHSALRCACETFGVDRMLLGTDWPMLPPDKLKHFVDYVGEALPETDAGAILDRNAATLLGLAEPSLASAR